MLLIQFWYSQVSRSFPKLYPHKFVVRVYIIYDFQNKKLVQDVGPGLNIRGVTKQTGRANSLASNASTGSLNEPESDDDDDDEDYDDEGKAVGCTQASKSIGAQYAQNIMPPCKKGQ